MFPKTPYLSPQGLVETHPLVVNLFRILFTVVLKTHQLLADFWL